jgi:hypothetical protein
MNNDDDVSFWIGFCGGALLMVGSVVMTNHMKESTCQTENNVADCTWVLVPTTEKE